MKTMNMVIGAKLKCMFKMPISLHEQNFAHGMHCKFSSSERELSANKLPAIFLACRRASSIHTCHFCA